MSLQSRRWTCVFWDEAPPEFDESWMQYLIVGKEVCPTTGKEHWQSYLEVKKKITLSGLLRKLDCATHPDLRISRGSADDNQVYCSKDGMWIEWGTPFNQGDRNDLNEACAAIAEGDMTVDDVIEGNPMFFHQYGRTLQAVADHYANKVKRDWVPNVLWIWGETGSGKSRYARVVFDDEPYYSVNLNDKGWWDAYKGEENILIDDFRGNIPFNELLKLLDRYEYCVPRRGRAPAQFLGRKIIITSSKHPTDLYNVDEDMFQLIRRITRIWEFPDPEVVELFRLMDADAADL